MSIAPPLPGPAEVIKRHSLTGLILAGGHARRMRNHDSDPIDKGLLQLNGLPLVAHARRFLESKVNEVLVSANYHLDLYAQYGKTIVDDPDLGDGAGPLAGVASALAETSTPWLMVIPVDVPQLPADLIQRLAHAAGETGSKVICARTNLAQPLCMLLHHSLRENLRHFLQNGGRKVQDWQQFNHAESVFFNTKPGVFFNINTQEDLRAAARGFLQS